jgi:hypothetical protein
MGLFSKANPGKIVADVVVDTAKGVADIVERWAPSDAAKHQMYLDVQKVVQDGAASARQYDPRTTGGGIVGELINIVVDAIARMIRPGVTILLIGGVFGWWSVATQTLDPVVLGWGEAVIVYWFGARTLFKDIPSLIKAIQKIRGKA